MTNFIFGVGIGITISVMAIYFSLPTNKETIDTVIVPGIVFGPTINDSVTSSQTLCSSKVSSDVGTFMVMGGGGRGHIHAETPAQIPDDHP